MNRLYFGDNLRWLSDRKEFPDASVDLIYLDPPFNSNADYNVLFREPSGQVSQAQFHAFTDTWSWPDAADTYHQFIDTCPNVAVVELMEALHSFLKHSPMMAYLAMMAPRLVELHRILKPTGSLYLHCDPTASHHQYSVGKEKDYSKSHPLPYEDIERLIDRGFEIVNRYSGVYIATTYSDRLASQQDQDYLEVLRAFRKAVLNCAQP